MKLCSRLEAYTGILMSPEGLNKRFNRQAVQFPSTTIFTPSYSKAIRCRYITSWLRNFVS
ncbi:hypothetical protein J5TS2_24100 [Brevibacillus halotolerans]|nr:hypothetical protein J5TS2_24100 [Brevibacillus halotolerans]